MPPTMLIDALQGIRRRVKLLGVVYGVGIAVAVAIALLLGTILFDYLLNLPAWPRAQRAWYSWVGRPAWLKVA